jgi:pilus assembly protein CpaF
MITQDKTNPVAPLQPWLDDPEVQEIMVDGHDQVYVEKGDQFIDVPSPFQDNAHVIEMVNDIAATFGLRVNEAAPMLEARLPDGSRMNAVIPPISLLGPALIIRKFSPQQLSLEDLIRRNVLSEDMVTFLRACVQGRLNIVVSGGAGSGKTTFLNLVAGMIPDDERIIVVQRGSELQLPQDRVVYLESRPPNMDGEGEITVRDLVINALRMRPDRIITGEVMGDEVLDLFQAMNTGHDGSMMALHANSARDVLTRLETMVTLALPSFPLLNVRQHMASAIHLITHQERMRDGRRKIVKMTEVQGMQGDVIMLRDIFEFRHTGSRDGAVTGHLIATGHVPGFLKRLREAGVELPMRLFAPS